MRQIKTFSISYEIEKKNHIGFIAYPTHITKPLPAIIVIHAFGGISNFERDKVIELAKEGFFSFALDLYENGKNAKSEEEAYKLMNNLLNNKNVLLNKINQSIEVLKEYRQVNLNQINALGFCFGGRCVLEYALSKNTLKNAISFHGEFPENISLDRVSTNVLVAHGYNDPLTQDNKLNSFLELLNMYNVNWELQLFGNTGHAFTNPKAQFPEKGMLYNPLATERAWTSMLDFIKKQDE
ncbi:dienelactone hydrolase family protein [Flavivirga sp. 57AJ16]|uniref:dienelactone hydrolase family protein n=1 Tax=Flavivirga sp. 57AJ16 TaxID=3025307 RepID=UPI0023671273|nr:alpha/beta fold hydrolase [Flavivirga sp. 57AJ16]MDD7886206.1 alpha/beta fold hydrolase [Flavivirga sp. 57AJ16]